MNTAIEDAELEKLAHDFANSCFTKEDLHSGLLISQHERWSCYFAAYKVGWKAKEATLQPKEAIEPEAENKIAEYIEKYRHDESMTSHRMARSILTKDKNSTFYIKPRQEVIGNDLLLEISTAYEKYKDSSYIVFINWLFENYSIKSKQESIQGDAVELKNILREFIMRGNYGFPMNEQDLEWFEAGIKGKTKEGADFLIRLFELSGIEAEARKEDV